MVKVNQFTSIESQNLADVQKYSHSRKVQGFPVMQRGQLL